MFPKKAQFCEGVLSISVFYEEEAANTSFGCRQQAIAKRARMKTILNGNPFAFRFVFSRRNRFAGNKEVVEPSGTGQAGFIGYIQKVGGFLQQLFGVFFG
jgi:hypothetical protein